MGAAESKLIGRAPGASVFLRCGLALGVARLGLAWVGRNGLAAWLGSAGLGSAWLGSCFVLLSCGPAWLGLARLGSVVFIR